LQNNGGILYLRTAEQVGAGKCGAVVAGIGKVDFWDTAGAADSGDKGELVDLWTVRSGVGLRLIQESNIKIGV
jgi:hypothetical protein